MPVLNLDLNDELAFRAEGSSFDVFDDHYEWNLRFVVKNWDRWTQVIARLLGWSELARDINGNQYISRFPPVDVSFFLDPQLLTFITDTIPPVMELRSIRYGIQLEEKISRIQAAEVTAFSGLGVSNTQQGPVQALTTVKFIPLPYSAESDTQIQQSTDFIDINGNRRTLFPPPCDVYYDSITQASYILRYVSRHFHTMTNFTEIGGGRFQWVHDPFGGFSNIQSVSPVIYPLQKLHGALGINYTWKQVPTGTSIIPAFLRNMLPLLGCVNSRAFDYFPPGSLLLTGIRYFPYRMSSGGFASDITYQMKYLEFRREDGFTYWPQRAGHNWFLRFTPGVSYDHKEVNSKSDGTGRAVYDSVNFQRLFTVS